MFKTGKLKPIIKYLKPYKKAIYATAIFVVLENATYLVLPVIYGKIVDVVTQGRFFENSVYALLAAWAAIELLGNWFLRIKMRRAHSIAYQVATDLITKSMRQLTSLPMSFHKSKKIGEIIERFSRADQNIYELTSEGLFEAVPSLLTSLLAFVVIAWISWILAIIYVIFILLFFFVTIRKTKPIVGCQQELNKFFEKAYGDIFDRTPNIISIKSNVTEEFEYENNIKNFDKGFYLNRKQLFMWTDLAFWQSLVFALSFLALFSTGIYLVSIDSVSIGKFVMLLGYINFASAAISTLGMRYKRFQENIVTINRAHNIFSEVPERYDDPSAIEIKDVKGAIEFKDVSFSYDKEKILENISFKAEAGKIVAIVGKSGEGKSTLVDLISLYNIPSKGKITLDGTDTRKIRIESLRSQIAIVPQEINLFNDTIRNNIAYSKMGATEEEIIAAAKSANCHEFIMSFPKKYSQVVGDKGVKLSTGQKQRVAIARAILRDPKILILDEATSALDSESEKYVQEALQEVMKKRTTFVIAHRLSTIRKADLILVIENGRIVESGDHKELLEKGGVYQKLSELQRISI